MEEKIIVCVSLVRDLTDNTILVIREKKIEALLHAGRQRESFPIDTKQIGENVVQCAIRATFEKTGITIKNPVEVARVKMKMLEEDKSYEAVFFISTEFSGSLHPIEGTDVVWQAPYEVKLDGQMLIQMYPYVIGGSKYVKGVYDYANDKFEIQELTNLTANVYKIKKD